jgi:CheY-like chemotaxis protein
MPVMDGVAAMGAIRAKALAAGASPPIIIAVTSNPLSSLAQSRPDAGFDSRMAKPVRRATLIAEISRLLPDRTRR